MGKSFKGFSKALSLILAVAMTLTMMPTSAYAADIITGDGVDIIEGSDIISTPSEDIVDTNVSDVVDTVYSNNSSDSIDTQKAADILAPEENTAGEEEADKSTGDVIITLTNEDGSNVKIFDPDSENGEDLYPAEISWDSTKDLKFTLTPDTGYKLDKDAISVKYTIGASTDPENTKTVRKTTDGYLFDKETGLVTITSDILSFYKDKSTGETDKKFEVAIPADMAKAVSYKIVVEGMDEAKYPEVSYDADIEKQVSLASLSTDDNPITTVEVYTKYVAPGSKDNKRVAKGNDTWRYDPEINYVYISTDLIKSAYETNPDQPLTIVPVSRKFTVSSDSADPYKNKFVFKQYTSTIGSFSTNYGTDIEARLDTGITPDGRRPKTAKVTITYDDKTSETITSTPASATAKVYIAEGSIFIDETCLKKSDDNGEPVAYATSVTVACETTEKVEAVVDSGVQVIYKGNGASGKVDTGSSISFEVGVINPAYAIDVVGYRLGSSSDVNELTPVDNVYTIPDITKKVTIVVKTKESGNNTVVSVAAGSSDQFTVTDKATENTIDGKGYAKAGSDYYFVVKSNNGIEAASVQYKIGDDGSWKDAVVSDETTGEYKVPGTDIDGFITLSVAARTDMVAVEFKSKSSVLWVDGEAKRDGFYINKNEDFEFTVKPATGGNHGEISLIEVTVKTPKGTEIKSSGTIEGDYPVTVTSDLLDGNGKLVVTVKTREIAKEGTYALKFTPDANSAYETDEEDNLLVALGETTNPAFGLFDSKGEQILLSDFASYTIEYASKSGKNNIIKVGKMDSDKTPTIKGMSEDSDYLVAKLTADYSNGSQVIFNAELKVTVMPHYVVAFTGASVIDPVFLEDTELAAAEGTGNRENIAKIYNAVENGAKRRIIKAEVRNGATGAEIEWNQLADGATVEWTSSNGDFYVTKGTKAEAGTEFTGLGDFGALVASPVAESSDINMIITDADGKQYKAETPITVTAKENVRYAVVTTLKNDNIGEILVDSDMAGAMAAKPPVLAADPATTATVKYMVVKIVDSEIGIADSGALVYNDGTTESELDEEMLSEFLKNGNLVDVTKDINAEDMKICWYEGDAPVDPAYITATPTENKGEYTISVSGKGPEKTALILEPEIENYNCSSSLALTFRAVKSTAKVFIGLKTNDDDKTVLLDESYLKGMDYSRGYNADPANAEDGYSFTVSMGSTFTLPEEPEHSDKSRVLLGWMCTSADDLYNGKIAMPGQTFEVPDKELIIEPIWSSRIKTDEANDMVVFRNVNGTVPEEVVTGYKLENGVPKEVTEEIAAPIYHDDDRLVANGSVAANEFSINAGEETGIPVGIELTQFIGAKYNLFRDPAADDDLTLKIYPEASAEKAKGKVKWYAYDYVEGAGSQDKDTLTVLDPAALNEGKIKGAKAGTAKLYAVYTDAAGAEWTTAEYLVKVGARETYSIGIEDAFPKSVAVGQTLEVEGTIKIYKDATEDNVLAAPDGIVEWTFTDESGNKIEEEDLNAHVMTMGNATMVCGIKKGTIKATAVYTDKNGVSSQPSVPVTINVTDSPYKLSITDDKGVPRNGTDAIEVPASPEEVNNLFYVTIWDNEHSVSVNNIPAGSLAIKEDGQKTLYIPGTFSALGGDYDYVYTLSGVTPYDELCEQEDIEIVYKPEPESVYTFKVPMKNYYTLTFDGSKSRLVAGNTDSNFAGDELYWVGINKDTGADGVTGVKNNKVTLRIYADDLEEDGSLVRSLSDFSADYSGTKSAVEFADGWTIPYTDETDPEMIGKAGPQTSVVIAKDDLNKDYYISPYFKCKDVTMTLSSKAISIEQTSTTNPAESKTINISTTPANSGAAIKVTTSNVYNDPVDGIFTIADINDSANEVEDNSITLKAGTSDSVGHYGFNVTAKPGMIGDAKLTVAAANGSDTHEVSVNIYGLYTKDGKTRYKDASGNELSKIAKDLGGTTYYFGADGNAFADNYTGPVWDKDSKLILLANGTKVTADGLVYNADAEGNQYYVKDGFIVTGQFVKVGNVNRYANSDGVVVTYAMTEDTATPGEYTDTKTGKVYTIDKETNAARLFHEHKWKATWDWTGTKEKTYNVKLTVACEAAEDEKYTYTGSTAAPGTDITVTRKESGDKVIYTATYTGATKYTEEPFTNTYEAEKHKHVWTFGGFTWTNTTYNESTATATYKCTESGELETVMAAVKMTSTTSDTGSKAIRRWTASVSEDPDGKEDLRSESKYFKLTNGNSVSATETEFMNALKGSYDGDEDGTFTAAFVAGTDTYTYTGAKITPAIFVCNGTKTLVEGVDYKVTYKNNTFVADKAAGNKAPAVVIQGMGDYTQKVELTFNIAKANLADAQIGGTIVKINTADNSIKPVVNYMGLKLNQGNDFVVESTGVKGKDANGNVTREFKIKAEGAKKANFMGSKNFVVTYVAKPANINITLDKTDYVYNGQAKDLIKDKKLHVKGIKDEDLKNNVQVTYSDNINAGTCKVTVTANGYAGSASKSFKIAPTSAKIVVSNEDELKEGYVYKSTGVTPYVGLRVDSDDSSDVDAGFNGTELVLGRDYKITYSKNKQLGKYSDGNMAPTAKITYLGNYKGNKTLKSTTFTINEAKLAENDVQVYMPEYVAFNPSKPAASNYFLKQNKNFVVTVNGVALANGEYTLDFTKDGVALDKKAAVAAGDTIGVKITPKGAKNIAFYGSEPYEPTETYEIAEAKTYDLASAVQVKILNAEGKNAKIGYTGQAIELGTSLEDMENNGYQGYIQITDKKSKKVLDPNDYTITYANNTAAKGTATVIISAASTDDNYSGSTTVTFRINPHTFVQKEINN